MVMFSKNWLSSLFSMIENGSVVVTHARGFAVDSSRQCRKMTHAQCEGLRSPKGLPSCSDSSLSMAENCRPQRRQGSKEQRTPTVILTSSSGRCTCLMFDCVRTVVD